MILCAARRQNVLGEGPVWDAAARRLYWVDIKRNLIEWLRPDSGLTGCFMMPCLVSAVAPRKTGDLLLATQRGFATLDPRTGAVSWRDHPEPERGGNRPNDGNTDLAGRFWLGTMDDSQTRRSGAVYRLDPDWTITRVLDGLGIPNTLVCSPDNRMLYVADSRDNVLYLYEIDDAGMPRNPRVFAQTSGEGTPDGSAVDEEGYLWNAQWGGWRVVRYAPDGKIDRVLRVPVQQPTSCAFGGDGLKTLYITSARIGLSAQELQQQELAGSVLAFEPGVAGLALPPFGG